MTEPVRVTRLPSGLAVVTEVMPRVETVSFGAYVAAGTRHEAAAEQGVSHFLEHMAFKGTARRSAVQIGEEIENVGGQINAYTARENTAYYVKILKEDLPLGADIIADIVQHSVFDAAELEKERGVILQEIAQANDTPDDIVFDLFQQAAYPDQPMGWPTLGTEKIIADLPRDALVGFQRRNYAPERTVIAAAGNLDHDAVLEMVRAQFAALPAGTATPVPDAAYTGGEVREARDLDQVQLVLGFPGVAWHDPAYFPVMLLSSLLGGGMSSRLFQEVREKRGLVYAIYSFHSPYRDGGLFGIYAGTGETQVEELMPVALEQIRLVQTAVTEDELRRAKAQLKASLLMSLESTGARCEALARHLQVFGRVIPTEETVARIAAVTTQDIQAAAARLFRARPTLAAVGPAARVPAIGAIADRLAA